MDKREVRDLMVPAEIRSAPEGKSFPGTLVGYASVFGPISAPLHDKKGDEFQERIMPGAFREAIRNGDIRALVNHKADLLIGRSSANTLRLAEDSRGLRVEIDLPNTNAGRDVAEQVRRGDMDGMSFSFEVDDEKVDASWDFSREIPVRTVRKVSKVYDVGPVAFPAYTDTRVALRSLEANRPSAEPEPAEAPPPTPVVPDHSLSLAKARQRQAEALLLTRNP